MRDIERRSERGGYMSKYKKGEGGREGLTKKIYIRTKGKDGCLTSNQQERYT